MHIGRKRANAVIKRNIRIWILFVEKLSYTFHYHVTSRVIHCRQQKREDGRGEMGDGIALAQVGAVAILSQEGFKGKTAFFGGINKCRFKGKVVPGDKLKLETKIIKQKGPMGIGQAIASVDGKVVAKAELTFMVG